MADERLFQIAFRVLVLGVEEFEDERVFDLHAIFVTGLLPSVSMAALFFDRAVRS